LKHNDLYTNPAYSKNSSLADQLMKVRMDSRGAPISRAVIGDKETYKQVVDKIERQNRKKNKKKSYHPSNQNSIDSSKNSSLRRVDES
jgi:hypothetical protein